MDRLLVVVVAVAELRASAFGELGNGQDPGLDRRLETPREPRVLEGGDRRPSGADGKLSDHAISMRIGRSSVKTILRITYINNSDILRG